MEKTVAKKLQTLLFKELDPAFARRARLLVQSLSLTGKEHVLEVGCGRGFYEWLLPSLYPSLKMTAIDRNPVYLQEAKDRSVSKNVHFQIDDAMKLSFHNNSFDRLIATEVLEHLPDDQKALKEFHRVLKKNGKAVFTVPHAKYPFLWDPANWLLEHTLGVHLPSNIWFLAGIWADHVRLYTEDELVKKCKAAGFTVEKVYRTTRYSIPFEHFFLYGIGKNIVEKGFLPAFHRFSWDSKPTALFKIIRTITYAVDWKNTDTEPSGAPTMNLIVQVKKA